MPSNEWHSAWWFSLNWFFLGRLLLLSESICAKSKCWWCLRSTITIIMNISIKDVCPSVFTSMKCNCELLSFWYDLVMNVVFCSDDGYFKPTIFFWLFDFFTLVLRDSSNWIISTIPSKVYGMICKILYAFAL